MKKSDIGVIGLATMGANLARNIANNGFSVSVYNRTPKVTDGFVDKYGSDNHKGFNGLAEFIDSIELPRKIIIMVKSGEPVDEVISQLTKISPLLSKGDLIIDCGNSNYHDTQRRYIQLKEKQIGFMGCGVSGGEEGALNGPSIMPGGDIDDWNKVKQILQAIAAKDFAGNPCVEYIGENGAGHFVKTVHNGIEYGIMQLIAESYQILRGIYNLSASEISGIFNTFNGGILNSYLIEITSEVLNQKDNLGNGNLIDKILDNAGSKGTGMWTVNEAMENGVAIPTICSAVTERQISSNLILRKSLSSLLKHTESTKTIIVEDKAAFINTLEKSLYISILMCFVQGFDLIHNVSQKNNWNISLSDISRIWQGGCIIRTKTLELLQTEFKDVDHTMLSILEIKKIQELIQVNFQSLLDVVNVANKYLISIPATSSTMSYILSNSSDHLPTNLIQGLRDYFGAHTYERSDREGIFHTDWN